MSRPRAFSLVELLVVIVIIVVLALGVFFVGRAVMRIVHNLFGPPPATTPQSG
ncbi:MAG: prepilin-type N-terminal cleavage/methylation domain-containing protein [Phycisphaeraceae bacterium]|nr:prepilin-type N-terminal cleavage/methylation domain-containing protein [Phycisphaeraceae bacterium]